MLYLIDVETHAATALTDEIAGRIYALAWSPDGCCLAYSEDGGIFVLDIAALSRERIVNVDVSSLDWRILP